MLDDPDFGRDDIQLFADFFTNTVQVTMTAAGIYCGPAATGSRRSVIRPMLSVPDHWVVKIYRHPCQMKIAGLQAITSASGHGRIAQRRKRMLWTNIKTIQ